MVENICTNSNLELINLVFKDLLDYLLEYDFNKSYKSWLKEDNTSVSSVDLEIQQRIIEIITVYFNDCNFICEETNRRNVNFKSDFTWVIDPIDGTKNFIQGKKEYSVSIGLMEGHNFIAALCFYPRLNEYFTAIEGDGVKRNNINYKIPELSKLPKTILFCTKTYNKYYETYTRKGYKVICYTCATYSILEVIKGNALFFHIINTNIYDVGPMSYILEMLNFEVLDENFDGIKYDLKIKKIPYLIFSRHHSNIKNKDSLLST